MTCVIQENVLGLEISVDDTKPVETFQSTEKFCSVEAGAVDLKLSFSLQMMEQLASVYKRQDQVELLGRLE